MESRLRCAQIYYGTTLPLYSGKTKTRATDKLLMEKSCFIVEWMNDVHSNRCGSSKAFPLNESFCEFSAAEGYEISVNRKG